MQDSMAGIGYLDPHAPATLIWNSSVHCGDSRSRMSWTGGGVDSAPLSDTELGGFGSFRRDENHLDIPGNWGRVDFGEPEAG